MSEEKRRLVPCASCARHLRVSEATCPFCGASVSSVALRAAPTRLGRRVTRAALAAGTLAITACGSNVQALYGGVPVEEDAGSDASDGSIIALYGGPPQDAGSTADADSGSTPEADSGFPPDAGVVLYGAPHPGG